MRMRKRPNRFRNMRVPITNSLQAAGARRAHVRLLSTTRELVCACRLHRLRTYRFGRYDHMGSRARLHSRLQRALGQIHVRFHFKTGLATTLTFHVLRLTYMDTWRYLRHLEMVFYLSFLLFSFLFLFLCFFFSFSSQGGILPSCDRWESNRWRKS